MTTLVEVVRTSPLAEFTTNNPSQHRLSSSCHDNNDISSSENHNGSPSSHPTTLPRQHSVASCNGSDDKQIPALSEGDCINSSRISTVKPRHGTLLRLFKLPKVHSRHKPSSKGQQEIQRQKDDGNSDSANPPGGANYGSASGNNDSVVGTPGLVGLYNLGNTCYLNAVVQCLAHIDLVSEYFVTDSFRRDIGSQKAGISTSRTSNSIVDGRLMFALAELIKSLWQADSCDTIVCKDFYSVVSEYGQQYAGVDQHDAHEFFMWLLDKLHEDSTKVYKGKCKHVKTKKQQSENDQAVLALAAYTQFHQSYIQGLFLSQYRSSIRCSNCDSLSSTFDPFTLISVPVPQDDHHSVFITFIFSVPSMLPVKYGFSLPRKASVSQLKEQISELVPISRQSLILLEVHEDGRLIHLSANLVGLLSNNEDSLYALEIPEQCFSDISSPSVFIRDQVPVLANALILVVSNVEVNYKEQKRFGPPMVLCVSQDLSFQQIQLLIRRNMGTEMREALSHVIKSRQVRLGLRLCSSGRLSYLNNAVEHPLKEPAPVAARLHLSDVSIPVLNLIAEWEPTPPGWHLMHVFPGKVREDQSCQDVRLSLAKSRQTVHLQDCINLHTKEETLQHEDAWTCPTCQHEQKGISRKLSLWSLPDIMVFHLKRFDQVYHLSQKISTLVEFPIHELNMSSHVATTSISNHRGSPNSLDKRYQKASLRLSYQPPPQTEAECIYDLQAVCNHVGKYANCGHYTAFCFNSASGHWYSYDDRKVKLLSEEQVVTPDAYILFYVRRKLSSRVPRERSESVSRARSSPNHHWSHYMSLPRPKVTSEPVRPLQQWSSYRPGSHHSESQVPVHELRRPRHAHLTSLAHTGDGLLSGYGTLP